MDTATRTPPRRRSKLLSVLCLLGVLISSSSCGLYRKSDRQWSFAVSRTVYSDGGVDFSPRFGRCGCRGDGAAAVVGAVVLVLAAPILIDIALLPVTGIRDLCND